MTNKTISEQLFEAYLNLALEKTADLTLGKEHQDDDSRLDQGNVPP